MKPTSREALDAYYREAGSWADDRAAGLRASRRTAWVIAMVAVVVALAEALALVLLTPLKTVVPYTLLVDRQTGFVQALKPINADRIAPDTALTQSFLVQYVVARESFDIDTLQANFRKVALWSTDGARADYVTGMQAGNPASPLARYPRATVMDTRVKSVSPLGGNAALVRFETFRRDAHGEWQPPRPWVAIVHYRFTQGPLSVEDRFINPLGFQVERYRRDQEALTAPEPSATPTVAAPVSRPVTIVPSGANSAVVVPSTTVLPAVPGRVVPGRVVSAAPTTPVVRRSRQGPIGGSTP